MTKTILVVDDSPAVRTLTRHYLEAQVGLEVCGEASDGIEAVEKALKLSPDLIVMDLLMPRMNGLEAARELKQKIAHVPIILFTAHENMISDAKEAGIWAIVSKSESHKLVPQVLNLLEQRGQAPSANV